MYFPLKNPYPNQPERGGEYCTLHSCSAYKPLSCKLKLISHTHLDGWDKGEIPDQDDPKLCRHILHDRPALIAQAWRKNMQRQVKGDCSLLDSHERSKKELNFPSLKLGVYRQQAKKALSD